MPEDHVFIDIAINEEQAVELLDYLSDPDAAPAVLTTVFEQMKNAILIALEYNTHFVPGTLKRIKQN